MTTLVLQPTELAQQLIQIARQRKVTPEALLSAAVKEFIKKENNTIVGGKPVQKVEQQNRDAFDTAFEREVTHFEQLLPELLKRYPNRAVAIYQGKVVASGGDILQVYNSVADQYGEVPCYVQFVASTLPTKRIPTVWKAR